jgi:hypothetical protein
MRTFPGLGAKLVQAPWRPFSALAQNPPPELSPGLAVVGLTLLVGLGAVAGRAMAPPGKSRTGYTVAGGALGLLGPLGLGVLGVISLAQRK